MEEQKQNTPIIASNSKTNITPAKKSNGMKYALVICIILALAGTGFGVYELFQNKTIKQQLAELKIEIKKDDSTTTIETDKINVDESNKTITIDDSNTREQGYFYLDEWGVKVKLPENFYITGHRAVNRVYGSRNIDKGSYSFWGGVLAENSDALWANDPIEHAGVPLFTLNRYEKDLYEAELNDPESYKNLSAKATIVYTGDDFVIGITPKLGAIVHEDGTIDENINNALNNLLEDWTNNKKAFFDSSNYSAI